jgi:hypothetical protein
MQWTQLMKTLVNLGSAGELLNPRTASDCRVRCDSKTGRRKPSAAPILPYNCGQRIALQSPNTES